MINENLYIAVDLGAGSGRVFLCGLGAGEFSLEEMHRFEYPPREENGRLRWDFPKIYGEIKSGLKKSGERARELNRLVYSVGVDSWAVDYGLIDANGKLLENPICYRDDRTREAMPQFAAKVPRREIFEKTGIQFLVFNTLFQLSAHLRTDFPNDADKILLLPDLINFNLTGKAFAEYTNATTTQIVNAQSRDWDETLIEKLNLPAGLLPEIICAGTDLGFLKWEIAAELNLGNARVVAPATHDTGSAVVGAPLEKNQAYISSGTWSLVGVERGEVLINKEVERHNFTNEGGVYKTVRFLKNVTGLWLFESCRREWKERGIETGYENLLREIEKTEDFQGFIFPDDERFLNPPKMLKAIREQMRETGQNFDENPVFAAKVILDSLAFRCASVLRTIENLTGEKLSGVQIVGGGGRNDYLNQMTANASGLTVKAGLTEATVTGNALIQAIAAGRFADLSEARNHVAENIRLKTFRAQTSAKIETARGDYQKIENIFCGENAFAAD